MRFLEKIVVFVDNLRLNYKKFKGLKFLSLFLNDFNYYLNNKIQKKNEKLVNIKPKRIPINKIKIFINEKVKFKPFGGGMHFLGGLINFLKVRGHDIVFKLKKNIDIIFIQKNNIELDPKILKYIKNNPNTKVLQRINISDISKNVDFQDKSVLIINNIADETVFISEWLAKYFIQKGFNKHYHVIYNGCNTNYFYPEKDKKIGKKIKLVTHHWSNNWMKGFDIYTRLDQELYRRKDIQFTFIGRYTQKYIPKNTRIIPPLYGKQLGNELRKHDIYLTAARWEGCGMHHIEGASCGLPVLYHVDGGGINEACKNYGIEYHDIPSLFDAINQIKNSYQDYRKRIPYDFLSIKRSCKEYYKILMNLKQIKY